MELDYAVVSPSLGVSRRSNFNVTAKLRVYFDAPKFLAKPGTISIAPRGRGRGA